MRTYNINSRNILNSTPFNQKQKQIELCKPFQNAYGVIYFLKGEELIHEIDNLYVVNTEDNKYDTVDKICVMFDDEQKVFVDSILEKIKTKLSVNQRIKINDN